MEIGVSEIYIESLKFKNTLNFHMKRGSIKTKELRKLYYTIYMKKNLL